MMAKLIAQRHGFREPVKKTNSRSLVLSQEPAKSPQPSEAISEGLLNDENRAICPVVLRDSVLQLECHAGIGNLTIAVLLRCFVTVM